MKRKVIIWAASILFGVSLAARDQGDKCAGKSMNISGNVVAFDPVLHASLPIQGLLHEENLIIEVKPSRGDKASRYLKIHIKTNRGFSLGDAAFSGDTLVRLKVRKCAQSPKMVPIMVPSETKHGADEKEETMIPMGRFTLTERYSGKFKDNIPVSASYCFED